MLSAGPTGRDAGPPRILIVDDDPNLLVVLAEQLRDDGYLVTTSRDGWRPCAGSRRAGPTSSSWT